MCIVYHNALGLGCSHVRVPPPKWQPVEGPTLGTPPSMNVSMVLYSLYVVSILKPDVVVGEGISRLGMLS
jgi:hypothetical protein